MMQSSLPLAATVFVPPLAPLVLLAFLGAGFLLFALAVAAAISAAARRRLPRPKPRGARARRRRGLRGAPLRGRPGVDGPHARRRGPQGLLRDRLPPRLLDRGGGGPGADPPGRDGAHLVRPDDHGLLSRRRPPHAEPAHGLPRGRRRAAASSPRRRPPGTGKTRHGASTPFDRPLRPGEECDDDLRLRRCPGAPRRRASFVGDPPGVESVLIGHENSPGHGKVYFALPG